MNYSIMIAFSLGNVSCYCQVKSFLGLSLWIASKGDLETMG